MIENYYESLSENAFADVIKATFSLNNIYHILDGYSQRERFVIDFNRWLPEASEESLTQFVKQLDGIQLAVFIKTLYEVSSKLKQPILDAILSKEMLDKNHGYKNGYGSDTEISPIRFLILEKGNVDLFNALDKKFPMDRSSLYSYVDINYLHLAAKAIDIDLIKKIKSFGIETRSVDYHDETPFIWLLNELSEQLVRGEKIASIEYLLSALSELSYVKYVQHQANETNDSDSDSDSDLDSDSEDFYNYKMLFDEHTALLACIFDFIDVTFEKNIKKSVRETGINFLLALVTKYFAQLIEHGKTLSLNPIHLIFIILGSDESIDVTAAKNIIDMILQQFVVEFNYNDRDKNQIFERLGGLFKSSNILIIPAILKEDKELLAEIGPKILCAAALKNNLELCVALLKLNTPIKKYVISYFGDEAYYPSQHASDEPLKRILADYELKLMKQELDEAEKGARKSLTKSTVTGATQTFFSNLDGTEHESKGDALTSAVRFVK